MAVTGVNPSSKLEESTLSSFGILQRNLNLEYFFSLIWWAGEQEADVFMTDKIRTECF